MIGSNTTIPPNKDFRKNSLKLMVIPFQIIKTALIVFNNSSVKITEEIP